MMASSPSLQAVNDCKVSNPDNAANEILLDEQEWRQIRGIRVSSKQVEAEEITDVYSGFYLW